MDVQSEVAFTTCLALHFKPHLLRQLDYASIINTLDPSLLPRDTPAMASKSIFSRKTDLVYLIFFATHLVVMFSESHIYFLLPSSHSNEKTSHPHLRRLYRTFFFYSFS